MRKRKVLAALALTLAALTLGGCGEKASEPSPSPTAQTEAAPTAAPKGALAEKVNGLMAAYRDELNLVAQQGPRLLAYAIPEEIFQQMALDAQASGAEAAEGRWRFSRQEGGQYAYETDAQEALDQLAGGAAQATPDPADEAPMDNQLNGDYAVTGGGLFSHTRTYDVSEDLSAGSAEFTDTLNGEITGREVFRFCVRSGELYFADAALDLAADKDSLNIREGYLASVGVLRSDGLEAVEYRLKDLEELPDPAALNWNSFLSSVTPLRTLSAQKGTVRENTP